MIFRFIRIVAAVAALIALYMYERWRRVPAAASRLPTALRTTLDELGVTFIKIGQALSMRPDLFPESYLGELRRLREHARSFPADLARTELERALGRDLKEVFRSFESEPFAAASIAQVHRATLVNGQDVIVKIRRPRMRERVDEDMRILTYIARFVHTAVPSLRRFQLERLAREIWNNLGRETDLALEARNIRRFGDTYKQRSDVYIPHAFEALSSEAVLVQVMSHGRSIEDPLVQRDGPRIAATLVDFYLEQFLRTGIFHGDPHPGNLFVMEDRRICFHDFGLVGYLDRITRRNLAMFLQAFVYQDANWMLDASIQLSLIERPTERAVFVQGIEEILSDYSSLPLKQWSIADAFLRVMRLGDGAHVGVPYNLLVLMRTLFLLEGLLRQLDPEFNVLDSLIEKGEAAVAASLAGTRSASMARLKTEFALSAQDFPAVLAAWLHRIRQDGGEWTLGQRIAPADNINSRRDRDIATLALALLLSGLLIASALLALARVGPTMFGIPAPAFIGFTIAVWLSLRLLRAMRTVVRR